MNTKVIINASFILLRTGFARALKSISQAWWLACQQAQANEQEEIDLMLQRSKDANREAIAACGREEWLKSRWQKWRSARLFKRYQRRHVSSEKPWLEGMCQTVYQNGSMVFLSKTPHKKLLAWQKLVQKEGLAQKEESECKADNVLVTGFEP